MEPRKHLLLLFTTAALFVTAAPAAIVLTNFPGPATTTSGIKGTGGFIPTPISYGFEFTVGGGDYELVTISLDIGTHLGTVPMSVDLFSSTTGPNSATLVTAMTGPSQPSSQVATYAPDTPVTLVDGATYFLSLSVNGNASSYGINRTSTAATGPWSMGNFFTRAGAGMWTAGGFSPETMVEITANPVPEPAAALLGCAGLLAALRRRR